MATFLLVGSSEKYWWLLSFWFVVCYLKAIGGFFPPVCLRGIGGHFPPGWCFAIRRLSVATFLLVGLAERHRWLLPSWLVSCYLNAIGGYFPPGRFG